MDEIVARPAGAGTGRGKVPGTASRAPSGRSALLVALVALAITGAALPAAADDLDIYRARLSMQERPNILFLLDYSGSMRRDIDGNDVSVPAGERRIDILRTAMGRILDANEGTINAGIGSLFGGTPSGVRWPIAPLDADPRTIDPAIAPGTSMIDVMKGQLDRQQAGGYTYTVDALVEAAHYFGGKPVLNGSSPAAVPANAPVDTWSAANRRYQGGNRRAALPSSFSTPDSFEPGDGYWQERYAAGSWNGSVYDSPITQSCPSNAIVLVSDGEPTRRNLDGSLERLIGDGGCEDLSGTVFGKSEGVAIDGNCGPEVVTALASADQNPDVPGSTVRTFTIGFGVDGPGRTYLERLANDGGGTYFDARNPAGLVQALKDTVDAATFGAESFVELAIDVDRATFSSADRAYMSVFAPSLMPGWSGNLKGYFRDGDGLVDTNGEAATVTDATGTRFSVDAQSFWSAEADGNVVVKGGASGRLVPGTRKLYTAEGSTGGTALGSEAAYALRASNRDIEARDLGLPAGSPMRDAALDWLQSAPMGDPLHSKSVSVDYGARQVVYVMTNQGLLHAIDATAPASGDVDVHTGGEELFAFMPRRLLANLPALVAGKAGDPHVYGLDGAITRWHDDTDADGVVDAGESLLLVFGMRRGGTAYHALDVSDPLAPKLAWTLDASTGFDDLAQTWSRAALVDVRKGTDGQERVLVFGGGYDGARLDDRDKRTAARGSSLYVVGRDGNLVREFDAPGMDYSFAADPTLIDTDADGLADRIYAADVGGQVWRVDFADPRVAATSTITKLADLHSPSAPHPFFSAPSVAMNLGDGAPWLSVALGSGDRTAPLGKGTANALFVLKDVDVATGAPPSFAGTIGTTALYDATRDSPSIAPAKLAAGLAGKRGWRVSLAPSEKSLSRLVSFDGQLMATTYEADGSEGAAACSIAETRRLWTMDIATSRADGLADDDDDDGYASTDDATGGAAGKPARVRSRELGGTGIPSAVQHVFPADSDDVGEYEGIEQMTKKKASLRRVYWHAR